MGVCACVYYAKFLTHAKIKMHKVVTYTFCNIYEKNHQMHTKENCFLFSASWCVMVICATGNALHWYK